MERDCKHGQLARSCNLCDAADAIRAAFFEGFSCGYSEGVSDGHPMSNRSTAKIVSQKESDWQNSDAKVNSENT